MTAEHQRLAVNATKAIPLVQWGPYLSERQWGTVREDYSPYGDAWHYFPFDHAHSRTFLWGGTGSPVFPIISAISVFAFLAGNGHDSILKERLFGLSNPQGNHGRMSRNCITTSTTCPLIIIWSICTNTLSLPFHMKTAHRESATWAPWIPNTRSWIPVFSTRTSISMSR